MDKKSKILLWVVAIIIVFSVTLAYSRIYILKDYQIIAEVSCDPEIESCYVYEDEEGEISYYKNISKHASQIPVCDPHIEECEEIYCSENESNCSYQYCDLDTLEEGETCDDFVADDYDLEEQYE
ncbi:MAG: hypothetical protein M0P71_18600 [Melioribacteraceae bacterium]|nr:hypothetical protein [Melioribacteraceae bacterium]